MELTIAEQVEKLCKCQYSSDFITQSSFICGENEREVIFEAILLSTDNFSPAKLRDKVQTWVLTNPDVSVGGKTYRVDSYCSVKLEALGSTYCEVVLPTERSIVKQNIVGGITSGLVFVALTVVLIVIFISARFGCWSRTKKHLKWIESFARTKTNTT